MYITNTMFCSKQFAPTYSIDARLPQDVQLLLGSLSCKYEGLAPAVEVLERW